MFNLFQPRPEVHLRRAMELLREANMARIEHQAAAEHHGALARMYADRAARLEAELREASSTSSRTPAGADLERLLESDDSIDTVNARLRLSSR